MRTENRLGVGMEMEKVAPVNFHVQGNELELAIPRVMCRVCRLIQRMWLLISLGGQLNDWATLWIFI